MTTTYVALLRGINLGAAHKVPMARLRELLTSLGHGAVRTHLNSGNAVFADPGGRPADEVAAELSQALQERFGFAVPTLVRTAPYLRAAVENNPYPEGSYDGSRLQLTFFSGPVDAARFAGLDPADFAPDHYRLGDQLLYLHTPDGISRSPLATELSRPARLRGLTATTRTWNTVGKLLALAEAAEREAGQGQGEGAEREAG